jgi:acyl-CoA thioesterase-1
MNFGIHDIKCPNRDGKNNTSLSDYQNNLAQIIKIVRAAGARKVIWCSTTLSPQEVCGAPSEDFVRYNQAAREVANAANAIVNDLYSFSLPRLDDIQIPRNSHFTPRGSKLLGEQVAAAIRASLFS